VNEENWRYLLTVEGRPVELTDGEATFGRSRTSTIRLDHDSVSRTHALMTLHRGGVTIRDLNSSNGTWIGGRRITQETSLADGARVQLGAAVVVLKIVSPQVPSEPTALLDSSSQPPAAEPAPVRAEPVPPVPEPPLPAGPPPAVTQEPFTASNLFTEIDRQAQEAADAGIHEDVLTGGRELPRGPIPVAPPAPEALPSPSNVADVSLALGGTELPRPTAGPELPRSGHLLARLAAVLVDGVILSALDVLLFSPAFLILYFRPSLQAGSAASDPLLGGIGVLCFVLAVVANVLYTAGLWAMRGRTPGKALLGLAVVRPGGRAGDGIGWNAALVRFLVMAVGAVPLGIGWWMAVFRKDRRALHDVAAGTVVVQKR
jgi:uncharacterized RDD family membrane protein YckC